MKGVRTEGWPVRNQGVRVERLCVSIECTILHFGLVRTVSSRYTRAKDGGGRR